MSSLTTLGINKNKKGFAPKINNKRNIRKSNTAAASTSTPASASSAEKAVTKSKERIVEEVIENSREEIKQEIITESSSSAVEVIASTTITTATVATTTKSRATTTKSRAKARSKATSISSENYTVDESSRERPASNISMPSSQPSELDTNEFGLTQEEIEMNAMAGRKRRQSRDGSEGARKRKSAPPSPMAAPSPLSAPSPKAPMLDRPDCAVENSNKPVLKIERITPGLYNSRKSMSRPLKEDEEQQQDDAKERLATARPSSMPSSPMPSEPYSPSPTPPPPSPPPAKKTKPRKNKGKGKATASDDIFAPKSSGTASSSSKRSTRTRSGAGPSGASIGIGIPSVSSSAVPISIGAPSSAQQSDDEEHEESGSRNKKSGKRKVPKKFAFRLPENLKTLDDITNDPAKVENLDKSMATFTKDIDGVVSKVFKELETTRYAAKKKLEEAANMTEEELLALKKKEEEEEELAAKKRKIAKEKEEERRRREADGHVLAESSNALQVRLVNGQIVLDTDSLTVERTENGQDYGDGALEIVEENAMTRRVNSQTYSKRKQSSRWDEFETEQFYDCISQFGTDFEMISQVMPGRTRAQIRSKFNREERVCPEKVTEYLIRKRKPLDIAKYEELAGIELEAVPEDFHEMQLA